MKLLKVLKKEYKKTNTLWFLRLIAAAYLSPPKEAVVYYRISKHFYDQGNTFLSKFFERKVIHKYGCYISMKAEIGEDFQLIHANGVVIGDGVVIGRNVKVYHQVTFGGRRTGDQAESNYPTIGNNVTIFTGAKLLGKISVGDHANIGANSVVVHDVEAHSVHAGIPAKRIK